MIDSNFAMRYHVETELFNRLSKNIVSRTIYMPINRKGTWNLEVTNCDRFKTLKHSAINSCGFAERGIAMLHAVLKKLNYDTQSDTQSDTQNVGQSDGQKLKVAERQSKILEVIKQNTKTTALDLAEILSVSRRTIERDLAKLTQAGYIKYSGSSKDGQWEVKNK